MVTFNKFNSFVEALAEKTHNLGADSLKLALSSVAPVAGNSVLADLTEIPYTNFGSRAVTTSTSAQSGGVYKLVVADVTVSVSGGAGASFRYVTIYNDTAASKELVGYYDYGSALVLGNGESLLVDFDATNGVLQIA